MPFCSHIAEEAHFFIKHILHITPSWYGHLWKFCPAKKFTGNVDTFELWALHWRKHVVLWWSMEFLCLLTCVSIIFQLSPAAIISLRDKGINTRWIGLDCTSMRCEKTNGKVHLQLSVLRYWLLPIALRSWTCLWHSTVSPASTVSMRFPLTLVISCNVWIVLASQEWPSSVRKSLSSYHFCKMQFSPIHKQLIQWHLRVISCLLKSIEMFE